MNLSETFYTVNQLAINPSSFVNPESNGCLGCLKIEEQKILVERINGFINANLPTLVEHRDNAMLQVLMQKLLGHCRELKKILSPAICIARFLQEFPLLKGINPANKSIDYINVFLKTPPQQPLEIWENILIRLKPVDLIRLSRTTKAIQVLCAKILVKEVNRKSLIDMGIDSQNIYNFLRSLGSFAMQITHLDLRETLPFSEQYKGQLRKILSLVPNLSFLAINSSELKNSHLNAITRLSKLRHLDLYKSAYFQKETLDLLHQRKDFTFILHNVQMRREIAINRAIMRAKMDEDFERKLDFRLARLH